MAIHTHSYTIERRVADGWDELRWCLMKGNVLICHRDTRADLEETLRRFLADKAQPVATPLISDSWESGVSLSDMNVLRRNGFDLRQD